jgi:hypothetical protein
VAEVRGFAGRRSFAGWRAGSACAGPFGSASAFFSSESFLSEIFVFLFGSSGPDAAAIASEFGSVFVSLQTQVSEQLTLALLITHDGFRACSSRAQLV